MAEARAEGEWGRASALMALIANTHRAKKSKTFHPSDFNPFARKKKPEIIPIKGLDVLREVFVKKGKG